MTGKSQSEMIAGILGDGDDDQRKKLIQGLTRLRDMNDDQLKNSGITNDPGSFRNELSESIYFLKTGEQIRYGFNIFKGAKEYADEAKFVEGLDFGEFEDAGARLQGLFDTSGGAPTVKKRAMGGPVLAGQSYLVGERGPEIFSPNIDGSIINNMRTEQIYQMISSDTGEGNISMIELPPIANEIKPPEVKVPSGEVTEVPNFPSANAADPYRILSPQIYGITV